ncbi:MAG: methyltransferase domain-containing protein [Elusimicrobiota bacterium]
MSPGYDPAFYEFIEESSLRSAELLCPHLRSLFPVASVLDVGCGSGAWLSVWRKLGVSDILGLDGPHVPASRLRIPAESFRPADLAAPPKLGRRFGLVQSLETAEHLPASGAGDFVDFLTLHGDIVLFSAAPPGQIGEHHVNPRPYSYWKGLFEKRGYAALDAVRLPFLGDGRIKPWYRYNAFLFVREESLPKLSPSALELRIPPGAPVRDVAPWGWKLVRSALRFLPVFLDTALARLVIRAGLLARALKRSLPCLMALLLAACANASRALVLLPKDKAQAGAIDFRIEEGPNAGVHRCEALGRGLTALEERPGWIKSSIDGQTIYYAPMDMEGGATIPGIYDVRNISPDLYEIEFLNQPEEDTLARVKSPDRLPKPYYSAVWTHWYSRTNQAMPVDMVWAEGPFPAYEKRPEPRTRAEAERRARQLAKSPSYYEGPFGRYGFANHTDRWDDPDRKDDPRFRGRPELKDFRWRDTNGCLKVRPDCLALLNEFIEEQSRKGRRVQYDVRELP